jgi:hypothetical protein
MYPCAVKCALLVSDKYIYCDVQEKRNHNCSIPSSHPFAVALQVRPAPSSDLNVLALVDSDID